MSYLFMSPGCRGPADGPIDVAETGNRQWDGGRGRDIGRSGDGPGAGRIAPTAAAHPAGGHADRPRGDHRHLQEHPVPAGVRAAPADPGTGARPVDGVPGTAGRRTVLTDIRGDLDSAGFVQVMIGRTKDEERTQQLA